MVTRRGSQVAFTFSVVSAVALTCIVLYVLIAGFSWEESVLLIAGCFIVLWAIVFSFFEIGRIARGAKRIGGHESDGDPDAARTVVVEPPTGHSYPHHETIPGSTGLDQGQLTSRSPDQLPPLREFWPWNKR